MGPWGGFITGLGENMEYVITPAVIVVGIGGYLGAVFGTGPEMEPVWWAACYVLFVGMNIAGVEMTFRFTVFITLLALAILLVFFIGAIPLFSWEHALNITPEEGQSVWLPYGWMGVAASLPFAIWFFLAIEQLPLAAEEAHSPEKDMPKVFLLGLLTLVVTAFMTLFLNAGIAPGRGGGQERRAAVLGLSNHLWRWHRHQSPCPDCRGRSHRQLSRHHLRLWSEHLLPLSGRYFPRWMSVTHSTRKTPHVALIVGAIFGYCVALLLHFLPKDSSVGAVLLNMAVFGAVISYVMQCLAFILLRKKYPELARPFRSPLGNAGAWVAGIISLVTLVLLFDNEDYRIGIYGAAAWYLAGLAWFAESS